MKYRFSILGSDLGYGYRSRGLGFGVGLDRWGGSDDMVMFILCAYVTQSENVRLA